MFLLTNLTLAGGFWVSETCFFFSLALRLEGDSSLYLTWQIFIFSLIYLALNQDVFSFFVFVFGRKEGGEEGVEQKRRQTAAWNDKRQKKKKWLHCLTSVVPFITSSILIIIILSEGKSLSTSACTLAGKATLWLLKVSQKTFILIWATEHADQTFTLIKPVDTLGEKVCLCMNNIFVI